MLWAVITTSPRGSRPSRRASHGRRPRSRRCPSCPWSTSPPVSRTVPSRSRCSLPSAASTARCRSPTSLSRRPPRSWGWRCSPSTRTSTWWPPW